MSNLKFNDLEVKFDRLIEDSKEVIVSKLKFDDLEVRLKTENEHLKQEISGLKQRLQKSEAENDKLKQEISELKQEISELKQEISELKQAISEQKVYCNYRDWVSKLNFNLEILMNAVDLYGSIVKEQISRGY